jgi:hypothetical protein|tara:strand:+ start:753 stop:1322 length:570 start_codon:yes stop_codon:yes gene_type:complete
MTKSKPTPSTETLSSLLDYDPETGVLTWKPRAASGFNDGGHSAKHNVSKWNGKNAGKPALSSNHSAGYLHGSINGKFYTAHRIIWKLVHGVDVEQIDHINGDRSDNRIENLRAVSHAENLRNVARHKRRTNPGTGVRQTTGGKWQAYLSHNGKFVSLGSHETPEKALAVRKAAEVAYGFHPNHGRKADT